MYHFKRLLVIRFLFDICVRISRRFKAIERQALRKLDMLDAAPDLGTLTNLPGNRLEALKENRKGQHSFRVNDQWRICFVWREGHAFQVEIVDYH